MGTTSVELFVDHSTTPLRGPAITVPHDSSTLTFSVSPKASADKVDIATAELASGANRNFGRRFEIVSFRWLAPDEI